MPKNSVKHCTNADVFGGVDGQHVRAESNTAGQPWKSDCCAKRKRENEIIILNIKQEKKYEKKTMAHEQQQQRTKKTTITADA